MNSIFVMNAREFYRCLSSCLLTGFALTGVIAAEAAPAVDTVTSATLVTAGPEKPGRTVTFALLDTLINPYDTLSLRQTIDAIAGKLPNRQFRVVTISAAEAAEAVNTVKPDFLFAPAGFTAAVSQTLGLDTYRIATRKTDLAQSADKSVGAAFVVLESSGIRNLTDMQGKRAASGIPVAIDGWLAAAGEIAAAGYDPEHFFSKVSFRNNPYPDVISELLAGNTDVAVLPACLLETARQQSLADTDGLKVINSKNEGLTCQHSTALYPDISLLALSTAREDTVRDITVALLGLKDTSGFHWVTNAPHGRVMALFKTLKTGPYAYLNDMSLPALASRWKTELSIAAAVLLFLIFNEMRLHRLVRRRTSELSRLQQEKERVQTEAFAARMQLAGFERRSIVQQMSGMIAHEINAPVGAIRTYAALMRLPGATAEQTNAALTGIDHEAGRIAEIIARVRSYARSNLPAQSLTSLTKAVDAGLRAFKAESGPVRPVTVLMPQYPCTVKGNTLELEILVLNLLRNGAAAAAADGISPQKPLTLTVQEVSEKGKARFILSITNPGHVLTATEINRLNSRSASQG